MSKHVNNVSVPKSTSKDLATITIPAKKMYLCIAYSQSGRGGVETRNCQIKNPNGTATSTWFACGVNSVSAGSGGHLPAMAIVRSNSNVVVSVSVYNYTAVAATFSGGIVGIPIPYL